MAKLPTIMCRIANFEQNFSLKRGINFRFRFFVSVFAGKWELRPQALGPRNSTKKLVNLENLLGPIVVSKTCFQNYHASRLMLICLTTTICVAHWSKVINY